MTELQLAFFVWIKEHDLFNPGDRERIAREFAYIAKSFGAKDSYEEMYYELP